MKRMKLADIHQEAAVSMSECFRAVADVLETNSRLDMSPAELSDMVADLTATLMIAQLHIDAMASTQRMMDRGYKTVTVEHVNVPSFQVFSKKDEDKE